MAFVPNQFLYTDSNVTLRDPQHAARMFTDDQFRLAPKHKFLFHVAFRINQAALREINLVQRHRNEINMLVKSCDLPSFTISSETLNQYNRKKVMQTTHKYNPININFHDDNMGVINELWQNYYSYYYADSTSASDPAAYKRNATKNYNYITTPFGLDNGSTNPFFESITIYQMARKEFVSYTLKNPIIGSWNHNKVDYSQGQGHDNTMQLLYEAVEYGRGNVVDGDPEGFGLEHYDKTPSPLKGSETASLSNFLSSSNASGNLVDFLNQVATQVNTYQNTQEKQSLPNVIAKATQNTSPKVSGLQGYEFPIVAAATAAGAVAGAATGAVIIAKQRNLG